MPPATNANRSNLAERGITAAEARLTEIRLTGPSPLYQKIKQYIINEIRAGRLLPGERVPSEYEIARTMGVCRMTGNRALKELTSEGVLTRIQGVGTFVAEQQIRSEFMVVRNIAEEVAARGHQYHCIVHKTQAEKANAIVAKALEIPFETRVFHSVIVHFDNDQAIQLENRYVNAALVPHYLEVDFTRKTPNQYLSEITPITRFEHTIEAVAPDAEVQKLLQLPPQEPCLRLFRRTWSGEPTISCTWLTHPGRLYKMHAQS